MEDKQSAAYGALVSVLDAVEAGGQAEAVSREMIDSQVQSVFSPLKKYFMDAALEAVGIDFDSEGLPTETSITKFINENFLAGTGLELSNAFNSVSSKREIEAYALQKINEGLGGELSLKSLQKPDLKRELKRFANQLVYAELAAGGGAISDAMGDSDHILKMIAHYEAKKNKPASDNPRAAGNIERQARYRANHHRHWEN
jgi:hypothetical protein